MYKLYNHGLNTHKYLFRYQRKGNILNSVYVTSSNCSGYVVPGIKSAPHNKIKTLKTQFVSLRVMTQTNSICDFRQEIILGFFLIKTHASYIIKIAK